MNSLYSNFATEEVVIAQLYLAERGTRNSNKSTYWMSYDYTTNLRILCERTNPALPKDEFFAALKSKCF